MRPTFLTCLLLLVCAAARAAEPVAPAGPAAEAQPARPRIGLVLSGGGARGAAPLGVLAVLDELLCRATRSPAPAWAP
jgi:NTE family protein